jgi:hypothetical protein
MRVDGMKYRHYKAGIYQMVCEAHLEAEPNVMMVVYKSADGTIWTRPKQVFFEEVMHEGLLVPRFAPIA